MAIVAGIDEAGFGPTLGPLTITGVAFSVPDNRIDACLWDTLQASCTHRVQPRGRRLPIADSKLLYRSRSAGSGLGVLERTALVMLAAAGHRPRNWLELLAHLAPHTTELFEAYPWYAEVNPPLPLSDNVGDIGTRANAVRHDCDEQGVRLVGVFGEPLPEGHYNELVNRTRNKAVVLLTLAMRIVDRVLRSFDDRRVRILSDRLGGRIHYRDTLMTAFPGFELHVVQESPSRSAYRLGNDKRICEIEFATKGESRHLPTALASVYSKYTREICMRLFNTYWSGHLNDLKPTAGYYTDARRWLRDAKPVLDRLGIDRRMLVRQR